MLAAKRNAHRLRKKYSKSIFFFVQDLQFSVQEKSKSRSEMETGRVEIIRPASQAGWNTGQILLFCNQKTFKHQPKYTYIFCYK